VPVRALKSEPAETQKRTSNLEVFAVGDSVTEIQVGESVYIPSGVLQNADIVEIDGEIKLMVSDYQIAIVW